MKTGKVIGNIWATRKEDKLSGLKLLIIQPIDLLTGSPIETPIVAADILGAGVGETVIYVGGSSARGAAGGVDIPVDATVVGIVDGMDLDQTVLN